MKGYSWYLIRESVLSEIQAYNDKLNWYSLQNRMEGSKDRQCKGNILFDLFKVDIKARAFFVENIVVSVAELV